MLKTGTCCRNREEYYESYSLFRTHREINKHLRKGLPYLSVSRRFWGDVTNLFQIIDSGFHRGGYHCL